MSEVFVPSAEALHLAPLGPMTRMQPEMVPSLFRPWLWVSPLPSLLAQVLHHRQWMVPCPLFCVLVFASAQALRL